jgi:predicted phosphodiesterase
LKIAVIADAHANLPALQAALAAIHAEKCDAIYHVGDAIAIGPQPAECVDVMLAEPHLECVRGNHELYFLNGLPEPLPPWMSPGEARHQLWTHRQLGEQRKARLAGWPMLLENNLEGVQTCFLHYGLTPGGDDFSGVVRNPTARDLEALFAAQVGKVIFFGHDHSPMDVQGRARYINPGSLGCSPSAAARFTIATCAHGRVEISHRSVPYDDRPLFEAFEARDVPERAFIYNVFFGGRFGKD